MKRIFGGRRYANVTSTLALVVALGGTGAYAANTIRSSDIVNGQVKRVDIANNAVTSGKVKDGSLLKKDFKASERASLVGPRGATGATGATGAKGDKGDTGAAGATGAGPGFFAQSGLVSLPASATTTVQSLSLPAGRFIITARLGVNNNGVATGASTVTCELAAGGVSQDLRNMFLAANGDPGETEAGSLVIGATLAAAGSATLSCTTAAGWSGNVLEPAIAATQVTSLN